MTLGEKIKALRTKKGITQEAFAENLNVSRSAIAKWESDIGVPEIINLKAIAKTFNVSIDELLDEEQDMTVDKETSTDTVEENPKEKYSYLSAEYADYSYSIDLKGWNDGVSNVTICGEDEDFLYYKRTEKKNVLYGLIGKKHITSVEKTKKSQEICSTEMIERDYFCNKLVCIEIAHKPGLLKGFFDFRSDDYMNVTINSFSEEKVYLEFDRVLNVEEITKIEEVPA